MMDRRAHRMLDMVLILGALALGAGALVWIWQQRPEESSGASSRFTSPADVPRPWAAGAWNDSLSFAPPPATAPAPPPHDPFQTTTTVKYGQLGVLMNRPGKRSPAARDPFYGERAVSTGQPFVWRAGEAEIELAALDVFQREARADDHEASLQGLYRPDCTPLTSATLIASGVPRWFAQAREHFFQQEQTKLKLLFHTRSFSGLQLLGLNVFDAQTSSVLSSSYSSSVSDDGFWLAIDPEVLSNRPLRIALTLAQLGTHTLEMEARDGATLSHPLASMRLQGVAAIGSGAGEWSSGSDDSGSYQFFNLYTPQPGNPSKAPSPPTYVLLLESTPTWGVGAFNLEAVDTQGRRMESRGGSTSNGLRTMQVEDTGSPPAKLIATVPERIVRIDFTLPGIPGMPELEGNDLLMQRVAAVRFSDASQLQRFLQSYGQMELDLGFGPKLTSPLDFQDVSLAELVEELDRQMLASNPRLRCEEGASPGAYKWSEPPRSRWQVFVETVLRRLGLRP